MARKSKFERSIVEREENVFTEFVEIILIVLIALTVAVIMRTQVSQARGVDGISMQPTYNSEESGYDNKNMTTYDSVRITRLSRIKRGDIIVFEAPKLRNSDGSTKLLIKRVIGVGGDEIEFREGEAKILEVYRNGEKLTEPYIYHNADGMAVFTRKYDRALNEPFTVPKGCYFVMGDNRDSSTDSRSNSVGFVPFSDVDGKVYLNVHYGESFLSALWDKVF